MSHKLRAQNATGRRRASNSTVIRGSVDTAAKCVLIKVKQAEFALFGGRIVKYQIIPNQIRAYKQNHEVEKKTGPKELILQIVINELSTARFLVIVEQGPLVIKFSVEFPRWHRERNSCQKHDITDITSSNDEKHITDKGLDFSLFTFTSPVAKACADKKTWQSRPIQVVLTLWKL